VFQQLLAEDRAVSGVVLDGRLAGRQQLLREALIDNGVHAILDPDFMQMTTPGGAVLAGLRDLPWSELATATAADLRGRAGLHLGKLVAAAVEDGSFTAVLAPTHLLSSAFDPMFAADRAVTTQLRIELDARGLGHVPVFYPLALATSAMRDTAQRASVIEGLKSVPIDGVWLRLHPLTATAGPIALRRYIEACWDLHRLGLPLTAEHSGTVGIAVMALGGVGGIESGITLGERFEATSLSRLRRSTATPFSPPPRIYLHDAAAFVSRKSALALFASRPMIALLGCRDPGCCARGTVDTLKNPRRHFVLRRTAEVDRIGGVPPEHRANVYVADILRPALLNVVRASGQLPVPEPALGQRMSVLRPQPRALQ
jgi:hypothetical protein